MSGHDFGSRVQVLGRHFGDHGDTLAGFGVPFSANWQSTAANWQQEVQHAAKTGQVGKLR